VLPGHPAEAVQAKVRQLAHIAVQAGMLHCGEELLSMSVGEAVFLQDGADAEQLLAEADRRMYLSKQTHKMRKQLGDLRERTSKTGLALVS